MCAGLITINSNAEAELGRLNVMLAEYMRVSGKTSERVLIDKGQDLQIKLSQQFLALAPPKGKITADAAARGWRVKVRPKAYQRADQMLGGAKSVDVAVLNNDGRTMVAPLTKSGRVPKKLADAGGTMKRLNRQALGVAAELSLRESGRGVLGASWLFRRWRDIENSRSLENVGARSGLKLGEAALTANGQGGATLRITSTVPGIQEVADRTGVITAAIQAVEADIGVYLLRKQVEELKRTLEEK